MWYVLTGLKELANIISKLLPIQVLISCVEFWELSHLTSDLSQAGQLTKWQLQPFLSEIDVIETNNNIRTVQGESSGVKLTRF